MAAVQFGIVKSLAYTGISSSYAALGGPITHNYLQAAFTNNTDGFMMISDDGVNDKIPLPPFTSRLYDFATNDTPVDVNDNFETAKNLQFYARYISAPSEGSVYLDGTYIMGQ